VVLGVLLGHAMGALSTMDGDAVALSKRERPDLSRKSRGKTGQKFRKRDRKASARARGPMLSSASAASLSAERS
jgi:hypothetical protein